MDSYSILGFFDRFFVRRSNDVLLGILLSLHGLAPCFSFFLDWEGTNS